MDEDAGIDIAEVFGASDAREQRFAVYIPNRDKDGTPIGPDEQNKWIDATLRLLSEICGGATAMPPVRGAWLNRQTGSLVIEEPVLVYTFIEPDEFAARVREIADLVHEIGQKTGQGQMAIEFGQALYLIDIESE